MIKQQLSSKLCPSSAVMIHDELKADDGYSFAQKLLLNLLWHFNVIP